MARRTPKTDEMRVEFIPNYRPFLGKLPIPVADICDEPCTVYRINNTWRKFFLSAMEVLVQRDIWDSNDPVEIQRAIDQVQELIGMSPCRCIDQGGGGFTRNGIDEIVGEQNQVIFDTGGLPSLAPDAPDTSFSEDTGDDAEEQFRRIVALCWACHDYVASVAEKGILQGVNINPEIQLTSLTLSFLFSPIVGIGFGLATTAIILAVTEFIGGDDDVIQVACCMFDTLEGLAVSQANFSTALDFCPDVSGLGASSLLSLVRGGMDDEKNFLAFVKILGAFMGATNDLSTCPCTDPLCTADFKLDKFDFTSVGGRAVYVTDVGWDNSAGGGFNHIIEIQFVDGADWNAGLTRVTIDNQEAVDSITFTVTTLDEFAVQVEQKISVATPGQNSKVFGFDTSLDIRELRIRIETTAFPDDNISAIIEKCELITGDCVFPAFP